MGRRLLWWDMLNFGSESRLLPPPLSPPPSPFPTAGAGLSSLESPERTPLPAISRRQLSFERFQQYGVRAGRAPAWPSTGLAEHRPGRATSTRPTSTPTPRPETAPAPAAHRRRTLRALRRLDRCRCREAWCALWIGGEPCRVTQVGGFTLTSVLPKNVPAFPLPRARAPAGAARARRPVPVARPAATRPSPPRSQLRPPAHRRAPPRRLREPVRPTPPRRPLSAHRRSAMQRPNPAMQLVGGQDLLSSLDAARLLASGAAQPLGGFNLQQGAGLAGPGAGFALGQPGTLSFQGQALDLALLQVSRGRGPCSRGIGSGVAQAPHTPAQHRGGESCPPWAPCVARHTDHYPHTLLSRRASPASSTAPALTSGAAARPTTRSRRCSRPRTRPRTCSARTCCTGRRGPRSRRTRAAAARMQAATRRQSNGDEPESTRGVLSERGGVLGPLAGTLALAGRGAPRLRRGLCDLEAAPLRDAGMPAAGRLGGWAAGPLTGCTSFGLPEGWPAWGQIT